MHLGRHLEQCRGPVRRQVDRPAGMPAMALGRLDRPFALHRQQRAALPDLEVGGPRIVEDLVPAAERPPGRASPATPTRPCCSSPTRPGSQERSRPRTSCSPAATTSCSSRATTGARPTTPSASPACTGPLGPCADATPTPILSSGDGIAGPGGESVFTDTQRGVLDRVPRMGPGRRRFPQQPRPSDRAGSICPARRPPSRPPGRVDRAWVPHQYHDFSAPR